MAPHDPYGHGDETSSSEDLTLDGLLSTQWHYDDDGFTARVMTALPAPPRRLRRSILAGAWLSGLGTALAFPASRELLYAALVSFDAFDAGALSLASAIVVGGAAVAAVWAASTT